MSPIPPKNAMKRDESGGRLDSDESGGRLDSDDDPVPLGDPMAPADHLDEETLSRIALFPEMSAFLRSRFGLSQKTNHQWFPVRPLGQGGFGGVALWERRDASGNVVEETAVKQSKWSGGMASETDVYLATEALIMEQLNRKGLDFIVYQKGFKCFGRKDFNRVTWRFYFEHCPYGDLGRLERRYKAWGTYFPEEFLWRTFHSLALVAEVMDDKEYVDPKTAKVPAFPYVLVHSDIKPINIFLGYHGDSESPWNVYPVVKVGDFGISALTNEYDTSNPGRFVKNGTAWYLPPESRGFKGTKSYEYWISPPFNQNSFTESEFEEADYSPDYTDRKVGSPHNVWAFGLTMHELLTHENAKTFSDRLNNMTEVEYNAWGSNTVPTLRTGNEPEYSHELRHLIRQCLNLKPSLRPTPGQILAVTGPMVEKYQNQAARALPSRSIAEMNDSDIDHLPKLYFKENEINDMPLGPHLERFGYNNNNWLAAFAFAEDQYAGPVWGPIRHPKRAQFAYLYHKLVHDNRPQAQNANGKRIQDAIDVSSGRASGPAQRPIVPPRPKRLDKKAKATPTKSALPPPAAPPRQGGFMAVNTPRGQQWEQAQAAARQQQQSRLDTIDQQLLESGSRPETVLEQSQRNVRNKRMRLWNDEPAPSLPRPMGEGNIADFHQAVAEATAAEATAAEETAAGEDVSMSG